MALRVLLADNSETIKKVIQLTLQDYAIDLRAVNLGVDVLDVALKFKPDIIFVDILLQKKSGYDVSREIKTHAQLKNTPVILMWSGFMEFDEEKAKESLADFRLEKPFDAQTLRDAVQKLTAKTKNNPLGSFLDFPTPPAQEKAPPKAAAPVASKHQDPLKELEKIKTESEKFSPKPASPSMPAPTAKSSTESFKLEDLPEVELDDVEEFEMKPLPNQSAHDPDNEMTKSFVLNIPDDFSADDVPADFDNMESIEDMSFLNPPPQQEKAAPKVAPPTPAAISSPATKIPDTAQLEKMVHDQVNAVLEKVAWQVVPELAAQIIKKELDRLLKDNDKTT